MARLPAEHPQREQWASEIAEAVEQQKELEELRPAARFSPWRVTEKASPRRLRGRARGLRPWRSGRAQRLEGKRVAAASLSGLVILELAAGSRFHLRDAAELLARHPELDLAALGDAAAALRLDKRLARVLADVRTPTDQEPLP